ncbi:unnamed protein product [Mycena citricolor]|uniref:Zinc finger PHD-type domain-containing protein n=1 Tax=Mycena citricolor TaxID=2018698 RepID=A0AAD2HQI4_9AGAR|nr:unnamed protein product [Mycena citricolor]
MSRRIDISSLLCDDPPAKEPSHDPPRLSDPGPPIVAEPVKLAPHLIHSASRYERPPSAPVSRSPAEQPLDTLARAAALAEKQSQHRSREQHRESSYAPTLSSVDDHHRLRSLPPYSQMGPPPSQNHPPQHARMLLHSHSPPAHRSPTQTSQLPRHHEHILNPQTASQRPLWDRDREPSQNIDVTHPPVDLRDLRPGRKSDPGQMLRPVTTSPSPFQSPSHILHSHAEPPNKKRRYSDSPGPPAALALEPFQEPTMSLRRTGERSILNPVHDPGRVDPPPTSSHIRSPRPATPHDIAQHGLSHRHRVTDAGTERLGPYGPQDVGTHGPPVIPARRSPPGSLMGRAKAAARMTGPEEPAEVAAPDRREGYNTIIHLPERPPEDYIVEEKVIEERRLRKARSLASRMAAVDHSPVPGSSRHAEIHLSPPPGQSIESRAQGTGPPHRRPLPPQSPSLVRQSKEEDAHEWLLEHFADPTPPDMGSDAKTIVAKSKADGIFSPTASLPKPRPAPSHVVKSQSQSPIQGTSASPPKLAGPTTMPEAAVALEQEFTPLRRSDSVKSEPKEKKEEAMDVDSVVAELVGEGQSPGEPERTQSEPEQPVIQMEIDVEDELLSLIDDKPIRHAPKSVPKVPSAETAGSRHVSPMAVSPSPPSFVSPAPSGVLASSIVSERESMPPPVSFTHPKTTEGLERKSSNDMVATKSALKSKGAATKHRAKAVPKPKAAKASDASGSIAASASRSRSASVLPGGSVGPEGSVKPEDEDEDVLATDDDKLYCVCKTTYDEDKFMIACDEWYHTSCVEMPDLVVDLVDQFFCPVCIEKNPQLSLKTTYKPRCRYGLDHANPDSPNACHKPAQGAFSKYCSTECGVKNLHKRIETFTKNGGKKEALWESVKLAERREAVVIIHEEQEEDGKLTTVSRVKTSGGKKDRDVANLESVLEELVVLREGLRHKLDIVLWRERLLESAKERADQVEQCGWDQRILMDEDEWTEPGAAEYAQAILDTYDDKDSNSMQVDEAWWCAGNFRCDRHEGWQTIRALDIIKEKEKTEEALNRLTTKERELRKRIEDIVEPFNRSCTNPFSASPLKPSKLTNGNSKSKSAADNKKTKKRKNVP